MKVATALTCALALLGSACSAPSHVVPQVAAAPGHGPMVPTVAAAASDVGVSEAALRTPAERRMRGPKPGYGPR